MEPWGTLADPERKSLGEHWRSRTALMHLHLPQDLVSIAEGDRFEYRTGNAWGTNLSAGWEVPGKLMLVPEKKSIPNHCVLPERKTLGDHWRNWI